MEDNEQATSGLGAMAGRKDASGRRVSPHTMKTKIGRLLWSMVQASLYGMSFHSWSRWRVGLLRMFGGKVAWDCTIRRTSRVYYPWRLKMGSLSSLGDKTEVYNVGGVTIGRRVTVSQEAYLCGASHDYKQVTMPLVTGAIVVGDDSWICARAFVGPGVEIGEGAIVAACGVAVRDVRAWTIVGGNPAKFIKERPKPV